MTWQSGGSARRDAEHYAAISTARLARHIGLSLREISRLVGKPYRWVAVTHRDEIEGRIE